MDEFNNQPGSAPVEPSVQFDSAPIEPNYVPSGAPVPPAQPPKKKSRFHLTDRIGYTLIMAVIVMTIGELGFDKLVELTGFTISDPDVYTFYMYSAFIGIWIAVLLTCAIFKWNRFILMKISHKHPGNNLKLLGVGLLIGFAMNMTCIGAALLHGDIRVYYSGMSPLLFIIIFLAVFIQSSAEEVLCRGYAYEKIAIRHRPITAVLATSAFFASLHLFNPGIGVLPIIDLFATGILFGFIVYYMDSIWCAYAVHAAWNFTQNILMGLPNSGLVVPSSVFHMDTASAYNSFAYNVDFGVEGTILAVIVNFGAALIIYMIYRNKKPSIFALPEIAVQERLEKQAEKAAKAAQANN